MENKNLSNEKKFLFLAIVVIFLLLTGLPTNFIKPTNSLTGATVSIVPIQSLVFLIGAIILVLVLIACLIISSFKKIKKNKEVIPVIPELFEEKKELGYLNTKVPLEEKFNRINKELKDWGENTFADEKVKKLTKSSETKNKFPSENKNNKPIVLESPKRKKQLERDLADIEQKLSDLNKQSFKKVNVIKKLPELK